MKQAVCDNCGATDDLVFDKVPVLGSGVVIKLRGESTDQFDHEFEICEQCRALLLAALPKLKEKTEQ